MFSTIKKKNSMHNYMLRIYNKSPLKNRSSLSSSDKNLESKQNAYTQHSNTGTSRKTKGQYQKLQAHKAICGKIYEVLLKLIQKTFSLEFVFQNEVLHQKIGQTNIQFYQDVDLQTETQILDQVNQQSVPASKLQSKISFELEIEDQLNQQIQVSLDFGFQSQIQLSPLIIEGLYESPSPFVVIYSMSLLLKYLSISGRQLNKNNISKLLLVSVILAYKYAFDQPLQQINLYFSSISKLSLCEVNGLQLKYLREMDYKSFISIQLFLKVSHLLYN